MTEIAISMKIYDLTHQDLDYRKAYSALVDAGFYYMSGPGLASSHIPNTGHFFVKGEGDPVAFMEEGKILKLINEDKPGFPVYHDLIRDALEQAAKT